MTEFRTIEIDFEVHRHIENNRHGFNDSPNDVLRRLLNLGEAKPSGAASRSAPSLARRSWRDKDVELRHGTAIRMRYDGHSYQGQIIDGEWVIGDQRFDSPSGAASGVAVTKRGTKTRLNGWDYWQVKPPGEDDWKPLRPQHQVARPGTTLADLGL